ncbi:MAG: autotransporter-associated beta strand repeat-containing protein [Chthoniobacter sp.]
MRGATFYWDPDGNGANDNFSTGAGLGTAGNWNTTDLFWNPGDGSADLAWSNAGLDTAYFWGTAATVTLNEDVTVGGLTFATSAYTLASSANTLSFGAGTDYIQLQNVAAATISASIAGTGDIVVASKAYGGQTVGTLTLSGGNGGFAGSVAIDNGMTVNLSGTAGTALSTLSGLTLNGGALTMTNTNSATGALDRVSDTAPIDSNGGTITYANTAGASNSYAETLGVVTLNSGRLNIISTTPTTAPATETLTLSGLVRPAGSTAVLAIGGSGVGANAQNRILVTGLSATPAGQVVGPWATFGSATAQTDYLVYDATDGFKGAAIAASTEDQWNTPANAYTANAATTLTARRTITALRYTGAAGSLTLASGANLETYGLLNGGTGALTVQPGTGGALTTPTGGGSLYFMTGNAQGIVVNAPITDNGGAVKVVHTGTSTLTLASAANSFSGGVVLNSGTLSIGSDAVLGNASGGVTFDGSAALTFTASSTLAATRMIALNNTALATINTANVAQTILGNVTGTGGLIVNGGSTLNLNGTNNDFQGVLRIGNGSNSTAVSLSSLADSAQANGAIRLGSGGTSGTFTWAATAVGDLVLNNRQIDLTGTTSGGTITNNSPFLITINTDLLVSTAGTKSFGLAGSGNGIFNGVIDGHGSTISLSKSGAGTWTLTGENTFTGTVSVAQGTLVFSNAANLGAGTGAIAIGSSSTTSGILTYAGAGITMTRAVSLAATSTGGATINSSGTGALIWQGNVSNAGTTKTFTLGGTYTDSDNTFSGTISVGTGNFAKTGAGTWVLTAANTFVNTTIGSSTVAGGTLRLTGAGTLGSGALTINSGTLETQGTANPTITTLTMGGGPAGSSSTIDLDAGHTLTLGGNVTFSATNNDLTSTITGGVGSILDFGGAVRTFTVGNSTAAGTDLLIDTNVTAQNGGLIKAGAGTLVLAGSNTLSSIEIQAGALVAPLGTTNLVLNGGVYETNGTFARNLGTGANEVQWTAGANGGFSAQGGALTVTLNGGAPLVWGTTPSFVSGVGQLLSGSVSSDNVVTWTNDIDLNNTAVAATRTIQVLDDTGSTADKTVFSGVLSGSGAGAVTLAKSGNGVLELQGNNTFVGTVAASAGTLQFSSVNNLGAAGNALSLTGGTLQFIGTGGATLSGTLAAATATSTISNIGTGTLQFTGAVSMSNNLNLNGTSPIAFTNTLVNTASTGTITVNDTAGATFNNINLTDSSTGRTVNISVADGVTATVNGVIANGGTGSSAFRKDGPGLLILNGANTFTNELRLNQGTLQINTTPAGLQTSTNSIVFNNANILGATSTLVLNADYNLAGGIAYVGNSSNAQGTATITGPGKLNLNGTRTFDVRLSDDPTGKLVIATEMANGTAAGGVTKTRYGTLVLTGNNTFTGPTTASEGTLVLDYSTNTGSKISATGLLSVGGGTLVLDGNASTDVDQAVTGLTVTVGGSSIVVDSTAGGAVTMSIGGALTSTSTGRSLDFEFLGTKSTIDTTGATGWTLTNGILGGWATYNGSQFATVDGSGKIVGLVATAKDDVSTWAALENVADSAGFAGTMANSIRINSLTFKAAATSTVNVSDVLNLDSGGVLVAPSVGAHAASINGGNLISGSAAFVIQQFDTAQAFTISSAIRGGVSVTKSGGGDLILDSSSNDYTGATQINHGTLIVMGGNAIGDTSAVTLDGAPDVMLKLMDDETIGSLTGGGADGGTVDIGNHTLTLTNGATYTGDLLGSGTIIKNGTTNLQFNTSTNTGFTGTVIADQGLIQLTGNGIANLPSATAVVLNSGGAMLVDNNGSSTTANRLLDTVTITLNSANGLSGTSIPIRGLWVRTDQNGTRAENVGGMVFNSGASYAVFETSTTVANTLSISEVVATGFTRNNNATLAVRGTNLGTTASIQRGRLRLATAAESAFTAANFIGGAGPAASSTISIVPWVVGEDLGTNLLSTTANTERGNSLVTYVTGVGFRPLNFTTEYTNYASAGATSNVRESLTADLTGLAGQTINSLVLNNASAAAGVSISGSGPLVVASGAFLFTAVDPASVTGAELATPQGITLGGFDSITVGPAIGSVGNEFILHVEDSAASGVTITSNLVDSTAGGTELTKSGLGTLFLTGNNTYTGSTTINEGTLDINSWNAIGGATGSAPLIMAGGTLRLEAGFSGDFGRPIQLADGGGILNLDATVSFNGAISDLGAMSGSITKTGTGNLTINTPASYTGTTTILGGVWTMGANQGVGLGDLVVNNATFDLQNFNATVGKVTLANAAGSLIDGTGVLTSNGTVFDVQQGVINAVLAGTSGLMKSTTSTGSVTLNGLNTYTGPTEVRIGTLSFNTIDDIGGGPSALGAPTTVANGTIRVGSTTNAGILQYTGIGDSSNRRIDLVGTTGGLTITQNGTGPLVLSGGILNAGPGAKTITLQGTSTDDNTLSGIIDEGGNGVLTLLKTGTGTWILSASNNYTGPTSINGGVLGFGVAQNLTGALQFGSTSTTATTGTLDLTAASAVFPSLIVQTNSSTSVDNLIIGPTQTLTINGNVALGSSGAASTVTQLTTSGGGSFIVNNPAASGTFLVGGVTTGSGQGSKTIVDLSGLSQFTVTLNTTNGVFRVNPTNSNNVNDKYSTLTLAENNVITAATLSVGDGAQNNGSVGQINSLFLGAGTNVFNVNTVNIGTSNRDMGHISFAGPTGTVTINNAAGTGRTAFNMGTSEGTGVTTTETNTFDVAGHTAHLLFGAVAIGTSNRGASYSNSFSFDTGTLDMTSLTMATRTGDATNGVGLARDTTSTFNIGGGTATIQNGITSMATAAGAYGSNPLPNMTATVNISGGTVSIGATSGTSISMGNFTATGGASGSTGSAVATLNLTGGVTTLAGNIVKGGTSAAINATVNLNGGTLDMSGKSIGATGASAVNFIAQSGTLKNLGQLNGGADLTKTSGGTLILDGANTYTGQTIVNEGTVLVSGSISGAVTVNDGGTLGGSGGTTGAVLINSGGILAPGASAGILNTGAIDLLSGGKISLELGATVAGTGYDELNVTGGVSLDGDLQLSLLTGFAQQVGDTYYVLLNDGADAVSGLFRNVTPLTATTGTITLDSGPQFLVNYAANAPLGDGGGNDISVTLMAVPEPASWSLLAASFGLTLGLPRLRRRR